MSDQDRLLSLTDDPQIEVCVKGRTFYITEQSQATLERVLRAVYPEGTEEEAPTGLTMAQLAMRSSERFGEHMDAFALILGADPNSPDYAETVQYLRTNLSWRKARGIYEKWLELNDVDSFLQRDGNALIPQREWDQWMAMPAEERAELAEKARKRLEEGETSSESSPKTPTSG